MDLEVDLDDALLTRLEAILMVTDAPVSVGELAEALEVSEPGIARHLAALAADFRGADGGRRRGFELRQLAGGWRIYSSAENFEDVARFVMTGKTAKLSGAALETLAVIAYRQPVSRAQIAGIRGVNVDGVIRTLLARDLITECGFSPVTGANLYETTAYFKERMGMDSLSELPALAPALPGLDELTQLAGELGS